MQAFETATNRAHFRTPKYSNTVTVVARADYAGNGGSIYNAPGAFGATSGVGPGPTDHADAATWESKFNVLYDGSNGVFVAGNVVKLSPVRDGASHTYLLGEKKVNPTNYLDGLGANDNETLYTGANGDIHCWASSTDPKYSAVGDREGSTGDWGQFGSAHTVVFQVAFCDGSIHQIPFEVDSKVHEALANRRDGVEVSTSSFE